MTTIDQLRAKTQAVIAAKKEQFLLGYIDLLERTDCHLFGYDGEAWVASIHDRKAEDGRAEFVRLACMLHAPWSAQLRQKVLAVLIDPKYRVYYLPNGFETIAEQFTPAELAANPEIVQDVTEHLGSWAYFRKVPPAWAGPIEAFKAEWEQLLGNRSGT